MQLLYVWIEEYKNIKEQGFNFSSEFTFEYDKESGVLTIDDNPNYIEGFFGENISNVTAIVGKNGSGKSNLLEIICDENSDIIILKINNIYIINHKFELYISDNSKSKIIFSHEIVKYNIIYTSNVFDGIYKKNYRIRQMKPNIIDISTDFILNTQIEDNALIYKNQKDINLAPTPAVFSSYKKEEKSHIEFILYNYKMEIINMDFFSFMPSILKIDLNSIDLLKIYKTFTEEEIKMFAITGLGEQVINPIIRDVIEKNKKTDIFILNAFISYIKALYHKEQDLDKCKKIIEYYKTYYNKNNILSSINLIIDKIDTDTIENMKNHIKILFEIISIKDNINSNSNEIVINLKKSSKKTINLLIELLKSHSKINLSYLNFKWDNNDYQLSSGEMMFLTFFSRLYDIENRQFLPHNIENNIIILIDEGDIYLHPNWQKKFIKYMILFLKEYFFNKSIQIILTSHSPFVISDLPKENVIFLDRDENGLCKVTNIDKHKQTFGANIHTLLSDGFFMDSLLGDFANEKIQKVLDFLNGKNTAMNEELAQKYINLIGEPIIKRQLQKMLDSKRFSEIDNIKVQIKELTERLSKLEG